MDWIADFGSFTYQVGDIGQIAYLMPLSIYFLNSPYTC